MTVKVIHRRRAGLHGRVRTKITPSVDDFANGITEKWDILYPDWDTDAPDEPRVEYRTSKPPYESAKGTPPKDQEEKK